MTRNIRVNFKLKADFMTKHTNCKKLKMANPKKRTITEKQRDV